MTAAGRQGGSALSGSLRRALPGPVRQRLAALRHPAWRARNALDELAPAAWEPGNLVRTQPALHPSRFAVYGDASWLVPPIRVNRPGQVSVGSGVIVMEGSSILVLAPEQGGAQHASVSIGDGTRLARGNSIVCGVGITIGERVASSDSVAIFDTWLHPLARWSPSGTAAPEGGPVTIGDGAYLGFNSVVFPGVSIGARAYVGEGAVVTDDVPAGGVVRGNPARLVEITSVVRAGGER